MLKFSLQKITECLGTKLFWSKVVHDFGTHLNAETPHLLLTKQYTILPYKSHD